MHLHRTTADSFGTERFTMVKIIADSTCDLSPELISKYDVTIVPLHIILGEQDFEDGNGITPEELFTWSDAHKQTPKTAACTTEQVLNAMQPILDAGDEVICFSISEKMSTTFNSMRLAAEELNAQDRVTVIDSCNLSTGIGLLVVEAAIMAKAGHARQEIAAHIASLVDKVRASFVVDTLTYLHRGGRCSGVAALVGSTLKLHPLIAVEDGKMGPGKKFRGKMSRVISDYAHELEEALLRARPDRVFITHSGCSKDDIDAVRAYLVSLNHFQEILITRAGCVISSHCGPGTLGVLFIEN